MLLQAVAEVAVVTVTASRLLAIVEDFLLGRNGWAPSPSIGDHLLGSGLLDGNCFLDLLLVREGGLGICIELLDADLAQPLSVAGFWRHLSKPCAS